MIRKRSAVDDALLQRVYGEFVEMPGLRLTTQQAQRLWGLDEQTCRELLDSLVHEKFLCRTSHGMYTRVTEGYAGRRGHEDPKAVPPVVDTTSKDAT